MDFNISNHLRTGYTKTKKQKRMGNKNIYSSYVISNTQYLIKALHFMFS